MTSWNQIYTARWGKSLDQAEVDAWVEEILAEIPTASPGEMSTAIRSLAQDERRTGRGKYPITCNDLISRIIKLRGEAAQANRPPPGECALCHHGWVSFVPIIGTHRNVIGAAPHSMEHPALMDIPCVCAAGEKALKGYLESKHYEEIPRTFAALRQQVIDVARRALAAMVQSEAVEGYEVETVVFRV